MSAHEIVWTHNRDTTTAELVCNDPECQYRWVCSQDCEVIYDVKQTADGYSHGGVYSETGEDVQHVMVKSTVCNFAEFLNADPGVISELDEDGDTFEIGRTAVEPVWLGEDGANWRRGVA